MTKAGAILLFVGIGAIACFFSLCCATRLAILIGGRLGEAIRLGTPDTMVLWLFIVPGFVVGSIVNGLLGSWTPGIADGHPDHAFYVMALILMLGLPFMVDCLGLAFLAATLF
jgi:hypothetical protein